MTNESIQQFTLQELGMRLHKKFAFSRERGIVYLESADYSPEQLSTPLEQLLGTCLNCDGTGFAITFDHEGEVCKEWCEACDGHGFYTNKTIELCGQ